ncbi:MAG: glutamine amidotransferase [Bacteroidales bacterium]
MYFAYTLPWWAAVLLVALAALAGYAAYFRGRPQGAAPGGADGARPRLARPLLAALRGLALLILLLALFRPLLVVSHRDRARAVVPILVDQSRSMRIADAGGKRRIDAAADSLRPLLARLSSRFQPELFGYGGVVTPTDINHVATADQGETDIDGALRALRGHYQGRHVAGVIVVSDGAETKETAAADAVRPVATTGEVPAYPAPVFSVGVGSAPADREVRAVTADQESLAGSIVRVDAVVSSRGLGGDPFDITLVAHGSSLGSSSPGRVVDVRRMTPRDGVPMHVEFAVVPEAGPVLYTVEVPVDAREAVRENNRAAVLVEPPARKRRILFVQGAPGFEHSFLLRAWAADPAVEVDTVVRKGKNDQGQDAFYIQADPARGTALLGGYPATKAALFVYDAVVLASVEWDFLTRDQLAMTADFVRERGGGVLVLGARSFASPGLAGSAFEEALPFETGRGKPSVALTSQAASDRPGDDKLHVTADGREHAIMRVGTTPAESDRLWAALPPVASVNTVGASRPGAKVLATATVSGTSRPLLAVQQYGRGRTAEFTGEGSWRWKMLMPATDRTHELFWRQVARWLSASSPDPVTILPTGDVQPGGTARVDVLAADAEFQPAANATVNLRVTAPSGEVRSTTATLSDAVGGRYSARVNVEGAGLYRVEANARNGSRVLGSAATSFVVGGTDPELVDPRLNEGVLRRIATTSNGAYVPLARAETIADAIVSRAETGQASAQPRDLWQHPLVFALLAGLLCAEWVLRRRWGFS